MTMHLAHPALSMAGKRKGKQKFRNSDEARKARELEASWQELQKKWGVEAEDRKRNRALKAEPLTYKLSAPAGRQTQHINSLDTGHTGAVTIKQIPQYTGDRIIGIGTLHKSNAVPIFTDQEAKDISRMRRG
jgi:hypothetical protein